MKPLFFRKACLAILVAIGAIASTSHAQTITVSNPGFSAAIGGKISGTLDLNIFDAAPSAVTQQISTSGWYGQANVTTTLNIGFRPQIEVNDTGSSSKGLISYGLGAGLGGLLGLEMPDSYLWQPLSGISLQANKTYTFAIDMASSSLLDLTALGSRGFGIGVTTGSTSTNPGTFFADSQTTPGLLNLSLISGSNERMTLTFTTGASPASGTVGLVVFAGRGAQGLAVSLLNDYTVDNASFAMVPEPSSALILITGAGAFGFLRLRRRRVIGDR